MKYYEAEVALQELQQMESGFSPADGLAILEVVSALSGHVENMNKKRQEIVKEYVKTDDNGNPDIKQTENGVVITWQEGKAEEANKLITEILFAEFEYNGPKVDRNILPNMQLRKLQKLLPVIS